MNEATLDRTKACSLAPDELEARLAWITQLNSRALIAARRSNLELVLEYRPLAFGDVEKLIEYEQTCCGFLSFRLDKSGAELVLTITAQETARAAAEDLFDQFVVTAVPEKTACCTGACSA